MNKRLSLLMLCLGVLTMLLVTTALAGTPGWPCNYCKDTEMGYKDINIEEGYHMPMCKKCNNTFAWVACSGGERTCTSRAICSSCGAEYGEGPLGHDLVQHAAKAPTCTEIGWEAYDTCSRCDHTTYVEIPAGHNLVQQTAKAPTCTEIGWEAYEACSRCDYTTYVEIPAKGHSYKASVTAPTCREKGYTTFVCANCSDTYIADYKDTLRHLFGPWESKGEGTHISRCLRSGCIYARTAECSNYEVNIDGNIISGCFICGRLGDQELAALDQANIEALDQGAIPEQGKLIVRGLGEPFEGAIFGLTVGYEYAGSIEAFMGNVSISLPLELIMGGVSISLPLELSDSFKLVHVNPSNSEGAEAWEEIPFTYEDGILTFETDDAGLFLLLPI